MGRRGRGGIVYIFNTLRQEESCKGDLHYLSGTAWAFRGNGGRAFGNNSIRVLGPEGPTHWIGASAVYVRNPGAGVWLIGGIGGTKRSDVDYR